MEVDDENPTVDHFQEPRQVIKVRLNNVPKTDIRCARPSEDNQTAGPSKLETIERRARSAEATRRQREKVKDVKKLAKTSAERQREYRRRKKIKALLKQQSKQQQDPGAIVGPSEIRSEKVKDVSDLIKKRAQAALRMRTYRQRKRISYQNLTKTESSDIETTENQDGPVENHTPKEEKTELQDVLDESVENKTPKEEQTELPQDVLPRNGLDTYQDARKVIRALREYLNRIGKKEALSRANEIDNVIGYVLKNGRRTTRKRLSK